MDQFSQFLDWGLKLEETLQLGFIFEGINFNSNFVLRTPKFSPETF